MVRLLAGPETVYCLQILRAALLVPSTSAPTMLSTAEALDICGELRALRLAVTSSFTATAVLRRRSSLRMRDSSTPARIDPCRRRSITASSTTDSTAANSRTAALSGEIRQRHSGVLLAAGGAAPRLGGAGCDNG